MDEQEFRNHADEALHHLQRELIAAGDDYGFEADMNAGALTIEFEGSPAKFVVSPQTPARQLWVSANSKSYKLNWDSVESTFVLGEGGKTLKELMEEVLSKQVGEQVEL